MIGGYTPNQKVFGKTHHTMRDACVEDMTITELEGQVDSRKLKELLENQELIQKKYKSVEGRERIKRALRNKIREQGVELAKNGDKVYYKKWRRKRERPWSCYRMGWKNCGDKAWGTAGKCYKNPHHQNTEWN